MRVKKLLGIVSGNIPLERGRLLFFKTVIQIKYRVFVSSLKKEEIKVIVGADQKIFYPGWINTTVDNLDITKKFYWQFYFKPASVTNILAEHILEHIDPSQLQAVFENIVSVLKTGGVFRVAVPDGYHPSAFYRKMVEPGGLWPGCDDHKTFFNIDTMEDFASQNDFHLERLEYFDKNGIFHKNIVDTSRGNIKRTAEKWNVECKNNQEVERNKDKFYESIPESLRQQFYNQNISYTSLLVDFIKN